MSYIFETAKKEEIPKIFIYVKSVSSGRALSWCVETEEGNVRPKAAKYYCRKCKG